MRFWEQWPTQQTEEDICSVEVPELVAPLATEVGWLAQESKLGLGLVVPMGIGHGPARSCSGHLLICQIPWSLHTW